MKFFPTVLLCLICSALFGQNPDASENIIARWKKGDVRIISITHSKEKTENGKPKEKPFELSYTATITVLDSTDDGYKMKWVFELDENFRKEYPGIEKVLPVYNGLKFIYTTEGTGEFRELLNWEEVRDAYVDMAMASMPKRGSDSISNIVMEKTKQMFNSKQIVESALIKEIQLYHMPYGGEFSGKKITSPNLLPNPFGGEALPAITSQTLSKYTENGNSFTINFTTELDSSGMNIMMKSVLKAFDLPMKEGLKDSVDREMNDMLSQFQLTDKTESQIVKPGYWTNYIKYSRIASTNDFKQTEEFVFTMKQ